MDRRILSMKKDRLMAILLALIVLVVFCVVSCEEECPPCTPQSPPQDPGDRLIGLWIVFEAFMNGSPFPMAEGMEWEFRDNDTLIVEGDTGLWIATDDKILVSDLGGAGSLTLDYYFEADTLDMTAEVMSDTLRLRLLSEENYPGP
jgi:hypothetical protein